MYFVLVLLYLVILGGFKEHFVLSLSIPASPTRASQSPLILKRASHKSSTQHRHIVLLLAVSDGDDETYDSRNQELFFEDVDITMDFDEESLEEMEKEQPSEWMIMTELLGINLFTFILAGLITFFLSMNIVLGPGWLGNSIGIQGTGSFEEVSPSLPGTLDLNKPEFRL